MQKSLITASVRALLARALPLFMVLCFAGGVVGAGPVLTPAAPQLAAQSWILLDANTGRILVEENANQQLPPASLTKMMTSYVVSSEMAKNKFNEELEEKEEFEDSINIFQDVMNEAPIKNLKMKGIKVKK